jgi:hypothetical protein
MAARRPVRHETIPVCRYGRPFAVIERSTNLESARTPSRMDLAYLNAALTTSRR